VSLARRLGEPWAGAAVALGGALFSAVPASAYCRGLTVAGPDPASTHECFGGGPGIFELFWRNRCVGYSLQKDASKQITLEQATEVAAQAFAAWSAVDCGGGPPSIVAMDEGPVVCSVVEYSPNAPNQHVIVFRDDAWPYDDPYNALALTKITYDAVTGEIVDADMEINSHDQTIVATGPAAPPSYDLASILTHEAGHFLGLAHSVDTSAVMYTYYRPGSNVLTADDTAGICSIYAPDGRRSTSAGPIGGEACDPTPRNGFTTACFAPDAGVVERDAGRAAAGDGASSTGGGCALARGGESYGSSSCALGSLFVALAALHRARATGRTRRGSSCTRRRCRSS
jgi:hypothetical protein